MLGVTYPLIYEFLFDQKISVGAPFYNAIFIPIVVLAAIFLFFSVDSKWSRSINFKFISAPISFSILLIEGSSVNEALRIGFASASAYGISTLLDVYIFQVIREKYKYCIN